MTLRPRVLAGVTLLALAGHAAGMTIRHDVADSVYIALAADQRYEAVGLYTSNSSLCSGVLVHPEWVLTAAHCNTLTTFSLGASTSQIDVSSSVSFTIAHPDWNGSNLTAGIDLRLVKLATPILDVTPAQIYRATSELGQVGTHVGYGRTGTGLTGALADTEGTKRAGENVIDFTGTWGGWSSAVLLTDFDSPDGSQSSFGGSTPRPTESGLAPGDSGGGLFMTLANGQTVLVGIHSFISATDGNANASYSDINGSTRLSSNLSFLDSNHDLTMFWTAGSNAWHQGMRWNTPSAPGAANAAVIAQGTANITQSGAAAKYVFVEGTGRLNVGQDAALGTVIVRRGGTFSVGSSSTNLASVTLTGSYTQQANTTFVAQINGNTVGSQYDRLTVTGNVALAGQLDLVAGFSPALGATFDLIISNTALAGKFDTVAGTILSGNLGLAVTYLPDRVRVTAALPGDLNLDGIVDEFDLAIMAANWLADGATWSVGDLTGNGSVGTDDLNLLAINWYAGALSAQTVEAIAVSLGGTMIPEPGTLAVLMIGLTLTLRRGRRQAHG